MSSDFEILEITTEILIRKENDNKLTKLRAFKHPIERENDVIYYLCSNYILASTSNHEKASVLRYFATAVIKNKSNSITYYLISMPEDKIQKRDIKQLLEYSKICVTTALTLKPNQMIETYYLKKNKDIPYYHQDRFMMLKEKLEVVCFLNYTTYQYRTKSLKVPIFFKRGDNAENFIKRYDTEDLYELYTMLVCYHVAYSTQIYRQGIDTVVADESDIRNLLPDHMSTNDLIFYATKDIREQRNKINCMISRNNKTLAFEYFRNDLEDLFTLRNTRRVSLPLKIFSPTIFNSKKGIGFNGRYLLFAFVFGYHLYNTSPKVNYKPSTLIKLSRLNTTRGSKYLLYQLNQRIRRLYEFGILDKEPLDITLHDLKQDIATAYFLTSKTLLC